MLWNRKSIIRIITEVGDIIMAEELTRFAKALPANIEDLSTFVVVGREKQVTCHTCGIIHQRFPRQGACEVLRKPSCRQDHLLHQEKQS